MKRILSLILTLSLLLGCMSGLARAESTENTGKYVQDVFIAYGKTEDEARAWLTNNGWEPVNGDFCAGKNSTWDDPIAAVMGIRRTDDAEDAVTDMAVINMTGGYSFPQYEDLLKKKKAQIDEFLNGYMPAIQEYRDNYKGKGSAMGKKRADQAYALLNRFYDGGSEEPYAQNDTGLPLGDLLLERTRQENNAAGADMQQIILESSEMVVILLEQMLALASDTGAESWLERLAGLTGKDLAKNLPKYVPEAAGQNLAASAINTFLRERFGDQSKIIASQWSDIRDELLWYEAYCDEYDLWAGDGETAEAYTKRVDASFAQRKADNKALPKEKQIEEVRIDDDYDRFGDTAVLYDNLYQIKYAGGWGSTLGDFFNPFDNKLYDKDADNFLTFAAAMSPGQRAMLEHVSLRSLLLIGFANEAGLDQAKPDLSELFGKTDTETGEELQTLSVYTGVNRGIFRGGVALTSRALIDQYAGNGNAYDDLYDGLGIWAVASYVTAAVGAVTFIAGVVAGVKGSYTTVGLSQAAIAKATKASDKACLAYSNALEEYGKNQITKSQLDAFKNAYDKASQKVEDACYGRFQHMGTAGVVVMCIGAAILIGAAFVKGYQLYEYYQRTFTPIPLMIVDESDIVTYSTDEEGNTVQNINFDQYEYYQAVKCNRQQVGEISDWQSGVSDYKSWGCGDVADLNGDFGQEWLALYTVKSPKKGDPILADTLTLQYGSSEPPKDYAGKLHKFTYTNAMDLGDTAYSFNNDKNGVYFFWDSDPKAYDTPKTASAFTGGQLAMSGAAGLLVGLLGATAILRPRKKKEQEA